MGGSIEVGAAAIKPPRTPPGPATIRGRMRRASDDEEEPEEDDQQQHRRGAILHEIGETVPNLLVPDEFGISHREILA
jgi:hypothetical protein